MGLRLVPLFHFYWIFVANDKLSLNLNECVRRHGIRVEPCKSGIALTYCILFALCIIPCLNFLFIPANVAMALIMHADYKRVASAIAEARFNGQAHAPLSDGFA